MEDVDTYRSLKKSRPEDEDEFGIAREVTREETERL